MNNTDDDQEQEKQPPARWNRYFYIAVSIIFAVILFLVILAFSGPALNRILLNYCITHHVECP